MTFENGISQNSDLVHQSWKLRMYRTQKRKKFDIIASVAGRMFNQQKMGISIWFAGVLSSMKPDFNSSNKLQSNRKFSQFL